MATQVQFRRGTSSEHQSFTGAVAEVTVDTDNSELIVHDGATAGGSQIGAVAGSVIFYASDSPPKGFLKANGAAVSRSTYFRLFNAIGTTFGAGNGSTTFELPDLRGEFPRGWDDGRGVDSGRSFGTAQLDQMQRLTGVLGSGKLSYNQNTAIDGGAFNAIRTTPPSDEAEAAGGAEGTEFNSFEFDSADSPNARVSSTTSGETRSRNVALLACIKF